MQRSREAHSYRPRGDRPRSITHYLRSRPQFEPRPAAVRQRQAWDVDALSANQPTHNPALTFTIQFTTPAHASLTPPFSQPSFYLPVNRGSTFRVALGGLTYVLGVA